MLGKTLKTVILAIASSFLCNAFAQNITTYDKFPVVKHIEAEPLSFEINNEIGGIYLTENNLIFRLEGLLSREDMMYYVYSYPDLKLKSKFGPYTDFPLARTTPASVGKNSITLADNNKLKCITFQDSKPTITCTTIDSTLTDVILLKDSVLCRESDFYDDYELRFYKRDGSFKKVGEYPEALKPRFKDNYMRYCAYNKRIAGKPDGDRMVQFYMYIRRFKIYDHNGDLVSDNLLRIKPSHEKPSMSEEQQIVHPTVIFTTDNYIYTLNLDNRYEYTPEERTPWNIQVFDWNGKPVKQYVLPDEINIFNFVVDEERGLLYGVEDNQVYKFKL